MEIRVLRYFLAVAREQSISGAAELLHLSQPTLSRQLMDMEEALGKKLFIRGNRRITLTEEGMFLRKRAEEIIDLVDRTETEIADSDDIISGYVYIGAGETDGFRVLMSAAKSLQADYPAIRYHITSGNAEDVLEKLEKGLLDFGLLIAPTGIEKYESLPLSVTDTWGVLMRRDSPLAAKKEIEPQDLWDKPLLISRQLFTEKKGLSSWIRQDMDKLHIISTHNLIYNASVMVEEGFGYAVTLDKLIKTQENGSLCFRPLKGADKAELVVVWKKYQVFSKAAELFLKRLKEIFTPKDEKENKTNR